MVAPSAKKVIASAPGALMGLFVSMPILVQGYIALAVLDFASGFLVAWSTGTVSSDASMKGMVKKAVAILLIVALYVFQHVQPIGIDFAAMVAGLFCVTEVISIVENAARAGLPIPKPLTDALAKLGDPAPSIIHTANGVWPIEQPSPATTVVVNVSAAKKTTETS